MKTLVNFLIITYALAGTLGSAKVSNGFLNDYITEIEKRTDIPREIDISVISTEQARNLFQKFAANKKIPFKYAPDGCYARATEMSLMAEKKGVVSGRVYAEGLLQAKLDDNPNFPTVNWGWHVAPVIFVEGKDGEKQLMVFDPSLFTRPATVDEWKNKMLDTSNGFKPKITELYFGNRFQYVTNDFDPYLKTWQQPLLDSRKTTLKEYLEYQKHPERDPMRRFSTRVRVSDSSDPNNDQNADVTQERPQEAKQQGRSQKGANR